MLYKENWEESRKRFEALWKRELVDRCCVSAIAPKKNSTYKYNKAPLEYAERVKYWTDPETVFNRFTERFENTYFGGDALPMIFLNLGAAGSAGYFGSHINYGESTIWFEPSMKDINEELTFNKESEAYTRGIQLAKYLAENGKDKFFVSMPDNAISIDVLSHLRSPENLLMDFVMDPDGVKRQNKKFIGDWKRYTQDFYDVIKDNNYGGSSVGWLNIWAPGKLSQMQCDLSVMISNEMFNEFVMEELTEGADWMEYSLYHFDGIEQVRHLDSLLSIEKLDFIQWTSVLGQPPAVDYLPQLKKIQESGKCLLINLPGINYVEKLMTELSSKGLYILVECDDEDEAREVVKLSEKLTHE